MSTTADYCLASVDISGSVTQIGFETFTLSSQTSRNPAFNFSQILRMSAGDYVSISITAFNDSGATNSSALLSNLARFYMGKLF